jgi:hypothetical protein
MSRRRYQGITMGAVNLGRRGIGQFDWTSLLSPMALGYDVGKSGADAVQTATQSQLTPATTTDLQTDTGPTQEYAKINATGLRMRSTAEIRADNIVATLNYGETVALLGKSSGIFELCRRSAENGGQAGWVASHDPNGNKQYLIGPQDALDPPQATTPTIELPDTGGGGGGGILSTIVSLALPVAGGLLAWKHRSM